MPEVPKIDIRPDHWEIVRGILQKHVPQHEVWAFGSRAKWTAKEYSDLDLAIISDKPQSLEVSARLSDDFSESDLPYKVDVVDWATTSESFRKIIERDRVVVQKAGRGGNVGSEVRWLEKPLGEIAVNHDGKRKPVKESERKKGSYPYYGASGIVDYVDSYLFEGRHLLIAEDGENLRTRQTPIAFMADGKFWVNNHAHIVTGSGEVTTEYLHYFLQNADIQSYLTGAVMPKLTQGNLNRIPVRYPEPDHQKATVRVLGALDAKIDLNRRINQTLEAMAQAIFKSWFVDFDPVIAKIAALQEGRDPLRAAMSAISGKPDTELDALPPEQYEPLAATAALFPDAMEESELGEIPRGWAVQAADSLTEVGIGKTPPRKEPQWFTEGQGDWRWVSIKDMGASGVFQQRSSEFLTSEAVSRFNVRVVPDRTVLLSFKLTIGRVTITDGPLVTNEAIAHFKLPSDAAISSEYLYLYLKGFDYSTLGSTSSIADAVNSKTLREMPVTVANRDLIDRFTKSVALLFEEMRNRQSEIASLGATRDALLPKLLSGEIEVPA